MTGFKTISEVTCQTGQMLATLAAIHLLLCLSGCAGSKPPATPNFYSDVEVSEQEQRLFVRTHRIYAIRHHQSLVQLASPELHADIQGLANAIAGANNVADRFRVYVINTPEPDVVSWPSGEIFVPTRFLEMIQNRDELAFGLAREIALQGTRIPLKHEKAVYMELDAQRQMTTVTSLLAASVIGALWSQYVEDPIQDAIVRQVIPPESSVAPYWASTKEGQRLYLAERMRNQMLARDLNQAVNRLLGGALDWVPNLITHGTVDTVMQIMCATSIENEPAYREEKDRLGVIYMQAAGFNPAAAPNVSRKLQEYRDQSQSSRKEPL